MLSLYFIFVLKPSRGSSIYQYYILLVELRKLICTLNVSSIRYWHIVSGYKYSRYDNHISISEFKSFVFLTFQE